MFKVEIKCFNATAKFTFFVSSNHLYFKKDSDGVRVLKKNQAWKLDCIMQTAIKEANFGSLNSAALKHNIPYANATKSYERDAW